MLMQLRPPPPRTVRDWTCKSCGATLGTIRGEALHLVARDAWLTADEAHARCSNCRSREHFPLRELAA